MCSEEREMSPPPGLDPGSTGYQTCTLTATPKIQAQWHGSQSTHSSVVTALCHTHTHTHTHAHSQVYTHTHTFLNLMKITHTSICFRKTALWYPLRMICVPSNRETGAP